MMDRKTEIASNLMLKEQDGTLKSKIKIKIKLCMRTPTSLSIYIIKKNSKKKLHQPFGGGLEPLVLFKKKITKITSAVIKCEIFIYLYKERFYL